MAIAIAVPLPAFLTADFVEKRISTNLTQSVKDRGSNLDRYPKHVQKAMPETVKKQIVALLRRDYGVRWNITSSTANISELPDGYDDKSLYEVTEDDVSNISEFLVQEILDAIDTSCRLVGGAASALASQGFPVTDDLNLPL